jgi:hypothetical protein
MSEDQVPDILFSVVPLARFLFFTRKCSGTSYESVSQLLQHLEGQHGLWPRLEGAERMEDAAIFACLAPLHTPVGPTLVVSEVSYRPGSGAFEMSAAQLPQFVATHRSVFKEVLFNGDVLILDTVGSVLVVFHHEGVYSCFDLKSEYDNDRKSENRK